MKKQLLQAEFEAREAPGHGASLYGRGGDQDPVRTSGTSRRGLLIHPGDPFPGPAQAMRGSSALLQNCDGDPWYVPELDDPQFRDAVEESGAWPAKTRISQLSQAEQKQRLCATSPEVQQARRRAAGDQKDGGKISMKEMESGGLDDTAGVKKALRKVIGEVRRGGASGRL